MERKSFAWIWAGVGLAAVAVLVVSGLSRRPQADFASVPNPMQPIIVEPIQPAGAESAPVTPLVSASAETAPAAETVAAAAPLPADGAERIRTIQTALRAAGYDPGPADGKLGRMTQKAIRDFQEAQGLSVDGKVGPKTWAKLELYLSQANSTSAGNE